MLTKYHSLESNGVENMLGFQKGKQVRWHEDGEMGIILWTTNRGSVGVEWDSGEYGEYNYEVDELLKLVD